MARMTVFAMSRWEMYSIAPNLRNRMRICLAGFGPAFASAGLRFGRSLSEVIFPALSELSGWPGQKRQYR